MSYTLIERKELTEAASSISFDNIPQFYTDLYLVSSLRSTSFATGAYFSFNGSTANFSSRFLQGSGSSVNTGADDRRAGYVTGTDQTANTFSNNAVYIANYATSQPKSYSADHVQENNATTSYQGIFAGLWNQTTAISSITITNPTGDMAAGSSVSLYGINRQQAIGAPKAIGGQIGFANGYWTHTFTGSGTFRPTADLTNVEYLVIGGGGGASRLGGGGAGGYRSSVAGEFSGGNSSAESRLNLTAGTDYSITIGAGGQGGESTAISGNNTTFGTITSIGGGRAGGPTNQTDRSGFPGGSGGGAFPGGTSGGTATANQGSNGGSASQDRSPYGGGGGGGAGAVGANQTGSYTGGAGGNGLSSSITGTSTFRAGGGAGGDTVFNSVSGGLGGGGSSPSNIQGVANTGGGGGAGGGTIANGGNGGSGVVIIRYKA